MKLVIVSGSHRRGSESLKVARHLAHLAQQRSLFAHHLIDLAARPFPLWDEGHGSDEPRWVEAWSETAACLRGCHALVVVSPEWGGMVPAALKNFFLLCGNEELGHKPALIVSVTSASAGGGYPVAELRMSSYKNNHVCYIPEQVIVREVGSMLNDYATPASPEDERLRERIEYALRLLHEYAKALSLVRASNVIDHERFPYGM